MGDILRATTPKALHATGVELGWYRTSRNGVRTQIEHAVGPLYAPSADDLGCMLTVEVSILALCCQRGGRSDGN